MKTGTNAWMGFCDDCLSTVDWLAWCRCDRPIELAQARTTDMSFVRAEVRPSLLGAAVRASSGSEVPPMMTPAEWANARRVLPATACERPPISTGILTLSELNALGRLLCRVTYTAGM